LKSKILSLKSILVIADKEFPGVIPLEIINYDKNIDLNSALIQTTDIVVDYLKSSGYNANELNRNIFSG
jgi:hypothetical protein